MPAQRANFSRMQLLSRVGANEVAPLPGRERLRNDTHIIHRYRVPTRRKPAQLRSTDIATDMRCLAHWIELVLDLSRLLVQELI